MDVFIGETFELRQIREAFSVQLVAVILVGESDGVESRDIIPSGREWQPL